VDFVFLPLFTQDFLICRKTLRHLAPQQGSERRVWECPLQRLKYDQKLCQTLYRRLMFWFWKPIGGVDFACLLQIQARKVWEFLTI
jgi:hypothetical protein